MALRMGGGAADAPPAAATLETATRESKKQSLDATLKEVATAQTAIYRKDGRIKRAKFHAAVLALRWEGFSPKETAELLGVSASSVDKALLRMRKAASMDSQMDRIDQIIVPLAVDNLARGVMDGDKQMTLKVLEGRGAFRTHKQVDATIRKTVLSLTIKTEMPAHLGKNAIPMPQPGQIVGAPIVLPSAAAVEPVDGTIVEEKPA